jgi:hypothetical protein
MKLEEMSLECLFYALSRRLPYLEWPFSLFLIKTFLAAGYEHCGCRFNP